MSSLRLRWVFHAHSTKNRLREENMQDMQDMLRRLNQSGKRLSKGHRRIAEYIVEHYDKAVFMTASKLGEKVGVSESTVVRFASAMGYEGYPQLQKALQELVRHWLTAVQRFEMATDIDQSEVLRTVLHADMQNIRATTEEIDTASFDDMVDKIIDARIIYVMGLRSEPRLPSFWGITSTSFLTMCGSSPRRAAMCSNRSAASTRMTCCLGSVFRGTRREPWKR